MLPQIESAVNDSQCSFSELWNDDTVIIACAGVLDMCTAPDFERRIAHALQEHPKSIVVDLTLVSFLASHGINVLVDTQRVCSNDIEFVVVADGPVTWRPMHLIGITEILTVRATVDDALAA
ncbi:STAS domain-containing protein [soil metagenome]